MVAVLFPTLTFAVFFAVVLAVGWRLSDQPVQWKLFMVVASYVFYGWWDPIFCLLLAGATRREPTGRDRDRAESHGAIRRGPG